ncbi:MAG: SGNH/GDSL hydrolase family protein, partial [Pseudomonadota bacterium]
MLGFGLSPGRIAQSGESTLTGGGTAPPVDLPPRTLALYGDSFAQRSQDVTGSPNSVDAGLVTPVSGKWATPETSDVGGVTWGFASWLSALTGRYRTPYHLNFAVGGLNTGQLAQDGTGGDYLGNLAGEIGTAMGSSLGPHGLILQAGTNDSVTTFSAQASYNNVVAICQRIAAFGIPVFLSTVLPRGNAANPSQRVATARIPVVDELNSRLLADLANEPGLDGLVYVVDPRADFRDAGGEANDVIDALTYDGLHLSPEGCRRLANAYASALDTAFPTALPDGLGEAADSSNFIANPVMAGTGGTVSMMGNATSNPGFTISG